MGVDMNFFIKIKIDDKYIDLPLYNREGDPVSIAYCGWALFDKIKEVFCTTSFEEKKEYVNHYYRDENEEAEDNDYIGIEAYEISLTYLMYLVEKAKNEPDKICSNKKENDEEDIDMNKFYTEIVNSINVMLNLVGGDYTHPDNIKIIMLATY